MRFFEIIHFLSSLLLICTFSFSFAQEKTGIKYAREYATRGDYSLAVRHYEDLIKKEPDNHKYWYEAGKAYLKVYYNRGRSIELFEKLIQENPQFASDLKLLLAMAYHKNYKFDRAISLLNEEKNYSQDKNVVIDAGVYLQYCHNAKHLMKHPLNVEIEPLGPSVNSKFADYNAFVDSKESMLIFSSRRFEGNTSSTEEYSKVNSSDIFMALDQSGKWGKTQSIKGLNSVNEEEITGLSSDGKLMILNRDEEKVTGKIFHSTRKGKSFSAPELFPPDINKATSWELTGTMSNDRILLFFDSDREGGFGQSDLYRVFKRVNGEWSEPENLGENINTPFKEYFPSLSADEKTLYFSSNGHNSMGGYDLFKSIWDPTSKKWGPPINLGYPINTTEDDMSISFSKDGRTAYISSARKGTMGDLDVFKVTFKDVAEKTTTVYGQVSANYKIDYNDYMEFAEYTNDGIKRRFPADFKPPNFWKFEGKSTTMVKPGYEYRVTMVYDHNGVEERFSYDKAPVKDADYIFKDVQVHLVPDQNFKANDHKGFTMEMVDLEDFSLTVCNMKGEIIEDYKELSLKEEYSIVLPVGSYKFTIASNGFNVFSQEIVVPGMSSYVKELRKDFILVPENGPVILNYSELKKR